MRAKVDTHLGLGQASSKVEKFFLKGIRWHGGSNIRFWSDSWVHFSKDYKIHSARPPDCTVEFVHDVIDQSSKSWKEKEIRALVSKEEADQILSIPISQNGKMDYLIWHPNSSGIYLVKSGYHIALAEHNAKLPSKASSSFEPPKSLWKFIWNLKVPPKLKHLWWKACCNFLATKENLHKRKCNPSPMCSICCWETESVEHLLFFCN